MKRRMTIPKIKEWISWYFCFYGTNICQGLANILQALGLSLSSRGIQWSRKSDSVNSPSVTDTAVDSVLMHNQVLTVGVDKKTDQVGAHVVTAEIGQRLSQMDLVEVNLFGNQLV